MKAYNPNLDKRMVFDTIGLEGQMRLLRMESNDRSEMMGDEGELVDVKQAGPGADAGNNNSLGVSFEQAKQRNSIVKSHHESKNYMDMQY